MILSELPANLIVRELFQERGALVAIAEEYSFDNRKLVFIKRGHVRIAPSNCVLEGFAEVVDGLLF